MPNRHPLRNQDHSGNQQESTHETQGVGGPRRNVRDQCDGRKRQQKGEQQNEDLPAANPEDPYEDERGNDRRERTEQTHVSAGNAVEDGDRSSIAQESDIESSAFECRQGIFGLL